MSDFTYHGSDRCSLYANMVDAVITGNRAPLVLLHGGGPDHQSLLPLAGKLADLHTVVLPDIRGYGRSVCTDPSRHTWAQYTTDVVALLDRLGAERAIIGGAGLGATITLRTALAHPDRMQAAILISVEDVEDDDKKAAEIVFMDAFAERVRTEGIEAGWEPILDDLAPIIRTMVREAIPRSNAASLAAAAAIGRDRSFRSVYELAKINVPTLIIPGMDVRHPVAFSETLARILPQSRLASVTFSGDVQTIDDFARAFAPTIRSFLLSLAPEI